jgi:hypothetical protein
MRNLSPNPIFLGLLLVACASGGPGVEEDRSVPVYRADDETPCEYEFIETLRVEASVLPHRARDYEEVRARELGRAGAKIGADAVILADTRQWVPFRVEDAQNALAPTPFWFEGDAVSWVPGTCKR